MINFVIVEDNKQHRERIFKTIVTYMMNNTNEFKIREFKDYDKSLIKYIKTHRYFNVYILDFELPSATAIDIAKEIREKDWESPIIILTAYTSLALDTFKQRLQILDFVGKQIESEKNIKELIGLCLKILKKEKTYHYRYYNVDHNIPINSILYAIRDGRRVSIITDDKIYYQNISIAKLKSLLTRDFIYCSKGIIINMKRVKELNWKENSVIFDNKLKKNILSKTRKKELEEYECI